ncbi:sigma 54-interacting transcriptional regulator [Bacillus canaveralius]|uniref:sigma 54-interacting transcriptional regulator n=1 Tax=Bacillus canaveralius TaxID=1403243 RepID=UPI000F79DE3E|nr:sigma 54-interacting transcriptional regulator [Bacillus canaveralius]RSK55230.1 PAS domain S-box protein [Bacillus canaveralius]
METQSLLHSIPWENILSSMHNSVLVVDDHGTIRFMNSSARALFQLEAQSWEGRSIEKLVPNQKIMKVLKNGDSFIGEKIVINGKQCMVNRTPLYEDGNLIGGISVIQDISEIEQYRNLLKQWEAVLEFSTDGIYVVNSEGITIYVNKAYEDMTGFDRKDLIGRHMKKLMLNGYIDQSVSLLVLEKKQKISIIQKIGGKKDVIVTGNPVLNESGEIDLVVTSVRDITQLNDIKHELLRAKTFSQFHDHRFSVKIHDSDQHVVFQSEKMSEVHDKVKQVAPYPTSILLSGPSGGGKEVFANLIHHYSTRKNEPFIKVNCGAIPEQLLESELFGYEKGAFTGANKDGKIGLLELADGGTVMFDEIGEMPLTIQVKMLRVIQEKQILRLGGITPRKLDIRIISATNKDLNKLIEKGDFREDLYYRLQVVEIHIPPLVERQEDILLLVDHYFSYFCQQFRIEKRLSEESKKILQSYHWPGNVRELRNLMENMIVSIPANLIEPHHLPVHVYSQADFEKPLTLKQKVENYEQRIVYDTIKKHPSLRKAAAELSIDHSTLVKKIKKWRD